MMGSFTANADWRNPIYATILSPYAKYKNCITNASNKVGIPELLLMAVIRQEFGRDGMAKPNNPNKFGLTKDYGIMQINDVRLIEHKQVIPIIQHDGCSNINLGARMLSKEITKAKNFWRGVGNYHYRFDGKYPKHHDNYIKKVHQHWLSLHRMATSTLKN